MSLTELEINYIEESVKKLKQASGQGQMPQVAKEIFSKKNRSAGLTTTSTCEILKIISIDIPAEELQILQTIADKKILMRQGSDALLAEAPRMDREQLARIKLDIQQGAIKHADNLALSNVKDIVEVAEIAALYNPDLFLKILEKFALPEPEKVKLVMVACCSMAKEIIANIDKLNLKSEKDRFDIARICLSKEPDLLIEHVAKFKVDGEIYKNKLDIACLKSKPEFLSKIISNVTDPDHLLACAMAAAEKSPSKVVEAFDKLSQLEDTKKIALAKHIAPKFNSYGYTLLPENIQRLKITDQSGLYEILKEHVDHFDGVHYEEIENFIVDEKSISDLVHLLISYAGNGYTLDHLLQAKNITDDNFIFEIAQKASPKIAKGLISRISDPEKRFEIVKRVIEENVLEYDSDLDLFKLTPEQNAKIALKLANTKPEFLAKKLSTFEINDQELLIKVCEICIEKASHNFSDIIQFVKSKASLDQQQIYSLIKNGVKNRIASNEKFHHFPVDTLFQIGLSKENRLKLLKLLLPHTTLIDCPKEINARNFPDVKQRLELFKILVISCYDFASVYANLPINDIDEVKSSALLAMSRGNSLKEMDWIKFIRDEKTVDVFIEIGHVKDKYSGIGNLFKHLENLSIAPEKFMKIIDFYANTDSLYARIALEGLLKTHLKYFDFKRLFPIVALLVANRCDVDLMSLQQNGFKLSDAECIALAEIYAEKQPKKFMAALPFLKISTEQKRFDLAMVALVALKRNYEIFSGADIKALQISQPDLLGKLIRKCLEINSGAVSFSFNEYQESVGQQQLLEALKNKISSDRELKLIHSLVNKEEFIEVFKANFDRLVSSSVTFRKYINEFNLNNREDLQNFCKSSKYSFYVHDLVDNGFPEYASIANFFKLYRQCTSEVCPFDNLFAHLEEFVSVNFPQGSFQAEINYLKSLPDRENDQVNNFKKEKLHLLAETLYFARLNLTDAQATWLNERKVAGAGDMPSILSDILKFGRVHLRKELASLAVQLASLPDSQLVADKIDGAKPQFKLLHMILEVLYASGVDSKVLETNFEAIERKGQANVFYHGMNLQTTITALLIILSPASLTVKEKEQLLHNIFTQASKKAIEVAKTRVISEAAVAEANAQGKELTQQKKKALGIKLKARQEALAGNVTPTKRELEEEILKNFRAVIAIAELNKLDNLKESAAVINDVLEQAFNAALPLGKVDDFASRYTQTFAASRMPMAIVTYAAKTLSLKKQDLTQLLTDYVKSVLEGDFPQKRFELSNNPHLQTLAKNHSDVLQKWQEKMPDVHISKSHKIVDSDEPFDLLLCGTEVEGSCQQIDGNPDLTKALLGYVMDGKNRLIAVKDENGKIVARCILRIMWDGSKPVLFRELIYATDRVHKYDAEINKMAMQKAEKLGLPILSVDGQYGDYGKPVHSLGSCAPWEYCDAEKGENAENGMKANGIYTIKKTRLLADVP